MSLRGELSATIVLAEVASIDTTTAMRRYYQACEAFDFHQAETIRAEVTARMESYLDLIMTMYRRLDIERRAAQG